MKNVKSLIDTMGKRERAYFNQLNKSSKDKIYVKIFEILVKDSTISFEGLSHALNLKGGKRRLSVELNYLYYHLLRSLHVYRLNTSSPLNTLFRELQFAKILIEKKLLDLALKSIKSIKKKAYRYEAYDVIIHAIVLEEEICFFSYESNLNKSISLLSEERKECIKLIEECNQLQLIKTIILDLQYNEGLYINEDNPKITCLTSPILYSSLSNSVTIEELKLLSKSVGFLLLGKYEKSRTFMLERIELIKNNLHLFSNRKRVTSINNFLFLCTLSTSVKDFTWKWDELLNCFNHLNVGEAHLFYLKYYLPLRMYCVVNDREKLKEILNELGNEPTSKFDLLSETECNELYHNVVWANILTGDIDTAFDYINKWLIIADAHLNYLYSRIFRMMIYYHNKEIRLLSNEYKTIRGNFKKKKIIYAPVNCFLRFIKKEISLTPKTKENIADFRKSLKEIDHLTETKRFTFELNFFHWLDNLAANNVSVS